MVGGSKDPLRHVLERRITRYKYRLWQHQSNPETPNGNGRPIIPLATSLNVVSDKKLGHRP